MPSEKSTPPITAGNGASPAVRRAVPGEKLRGAEKVARNPVRFAPEPVGPRPRKPRWIRVRTGASPRVQQLKHVLRENRLHTVCEEATCPNLGECFAQGTATFMIMGDICTRRCPFCDVAHGRPNPLDAGEPARLAGTIEAMGLRYVVITSVDRDDLRDGGAQHFVDCIRAIRQRSPRATVEILTPDFRGRVSRALDILREAPPDVFNHNLETVPRLYRAVRPGADYRCSLGLLQRFREHNPRTPTKSGLMLGLGETRDEIEAVMGDLRRHRVEMLTLGQYLQPSTHHLAVERFVPPDEFDALRDVGRSMGFAHVAAGPLVRSSYHADAMFSASS